MILLIFERIPEFISLIHFRLFKFLQSFFGITHVKMCINEAKINMKKQ